MVDWPSELPHFIVKDSFRLVRPARPSHRTEFEDGPQRGRRSSSKNIATIAIELSFTGAEFQQWVAFERDELIDGTLPFVMPVWLAAGTYDDRTVHIVAQGDGASYSTTSRFPFTQVGLLLDVEDWGEPAEEP